MTLHYYIFLSFCLLANIYIQGMNNVNLIALQKQDKEEIQVFIDSCKYKNEYAYVPEVPWKSSINLAKTKNSYEPGDPINYHICPTTGSQGFIDGLGGIYTATKLGDDHEDYAHSAPLNQQWQVTIIQPPITGHDIYTSLQQHLVMQNPSRHQYQADSSTAFTQALNAIMQPHYHTIIRCGPKHIAVAKRNKEINVYNNKTGRLTNTLSLGYYISDMVFAPKNILFVLGAEYKHVGCMYTEISKQTLVKIDLQSDKQDASITIPRDLTYDPIIINDQQELSLIGYTIEDKQEFAFTYDQDLNQKRCKQHAYISDTEDGIPSLECSTECHQLYIDLNAAENNEPDNVHSLFFLRHFPHLHAKLIDTMRKKKLYSINTYLESLYITGNITQQRPILAHFLNNFIKNSVNEKNKSLIYDKTLGKWFSKEDITAYIGITDIISHYREKIDEKDPAKWINLNQHWTNLLENDTNKKRLLDEDKDAATSLIGTINGYKIYKSPLGQLFCQIKGTSKFTLSNASSLFINHLIKKNIHTLDNVSDDDKISLSSPIIPSHTLMLVPQKVIGETRYSITELPNKKSDKILGQSVYKKNSSIHSFISHTNKKAAFLNLIGKDTNTLVKPFVYYISLENNIKQNISRSSNEKFTRGIFTQKGEPAVYLRPKSRWDYIKYILYPETRIFKENEKEKKLTYDSFQDDTRIFKTQSTWRDFFGRCKDVWYMMRGQL
ncbi:MAG TPA: hypothetical protein VGW78_06605 [Candidatus Babeliales bacterium]|nr:hypothetical protein [Candidatus Babeliales bacterium]